MAHLSPFLSTLQPSVSQAVTSNMASATNLESASTFRKRPFAQLNNRHVYILTFLLFFYFFLLRSLADEFVFPGAVWASVVVTVTTVSATQAASMAPASSPGSATARRDGAASSAIRVSLPSSFTATWGHTACFVCRLTADVCEYSFSLVF